MVEEFQLGFTLTNLDNLEKEINNYIKTFDNKVYQGNRLEFLKKVQVEQNIFEQKLSEFIR